MSVLSKATGGDGWSSWAVSREVGIGDVYTVVVTSRAESDANGPHEIARETFRCHGIRAVEKAIGISADYAHRMAN